MITYNAISELIYITLLITYVMITSLLKKHSIKNNDQKLVLRKYSPYKTVWWYFKLILIAYKNIQCPKLYYF